MKRPGSEESTFYLNLFHVTKTSDKRPLFGVVYTESFVVLSSPPIHLPRDQDVDLELSCRDPRTVSKVNFNLKVPSLLVIFFSVAFSPKGSKEGEDSQYL